MKYVGLFVALLMGFSTVKAQDMSLGMAINYLNVYSKDFTPILGAADTNHPGNYVSTFKVKEAKDSYFSKGKINLFGQELDTLAFRADFGTFYRLADLNTFVQELEKLVKKDFPALRFAQSNVGERVDDWNYWVLWDTADRSNRLACYLEAIKKGNTYNLSFVYPLVQKGNPYKQYTCFQNEADTTLFTKVIADLLVEATRDFSGIKGKRVDGVEKTYRTEHLPFILMDSYIVDLGPEKAQFHLYLNKELSVDKMKQEAGQFFDMLKGALGKDYAYSISSDGLDVVIVHKQYPAVPLAFIDVSVTKNLFSIEAVFYSNRLSPTLFTK